MIEKEEDTVDMNGRKKKKRILIVTGCIICAVLCRMITKFDIVTGTLNSSFSILRSLIYIGIVIAWGISIYQRILNSSVRHYLLLIDALLLLWMLIRTSKYLFLTKLNLASCFCWYGFYIPMLLIPLMGIFVALCLGEPEYYQIPIKCKGLYIPDILLLIMIFTNNIHQKVFKFADGKPSPDIYNYGPGYFLTVLWMLVEIFFFIIIMLKKSHVPGKSKRIMIPMIPFILGILYAVGYIIHLPILYIVAGDMTVVFLLIMIAFCELCIQCGLIPANEFYEELFKASTLGAQITDDEYQTCYSSDTARDFSTSIMKAAEKMPVDLGYEQLMNAKIHGGHILWINDISKMKILLEELEKTKQELSKKNDILESEVILKEKKVQAEEQARLYDKIASEVEPQLKVLEKLLRQLDEKEKIRQTLAKICVISSYIKRLGNLILLGEDANYLKAQELELCFRESVENIRLCISGTSFQSNYEGYAEKEDMIMIYKAFEVILEDVIDSFEALLVNLDIKEGSIKLKLNISCKRTEIETIRQHLSSMNLICDIRIQDEDYYITIENQKEGNVL